MLLLIDFVTKQRIEPKVVYCCKWEQIFTAVVAMPCFIWKIDLLGINIIWVVVF